MIEAGWFGPSDCRAQPSRRDAESAYDTGSLKLRKGYEERSTMTRRSNVVSERDMRWAEHSHGEKFGYKRKSLSSATGGEKLGCSLYEVPQGRRAWPYHYHGANEEAIYVLDGSGILRVGGQEVPLGKGDYATFPASAEGAHQLVNTSDEPLKYLCFSTMIEPDAMVYPDSGKVGVFMGAAPGGPKEKRTLSGFFRKQDGVDYYEGEG
jgi:uncharacterized cupin superfamily protein